MSPRLWSTRRQIPTEASKLEDVRWDMAAIALDRYLQQVILSGFCLVSATALAAYYYRDPWLWLAVEVGLPISALRIGTVYGFYAEFKKDRKNYAFWAVSFGMLTVLFCLTMSLLNIYNFYIHDLGAQALCVTGSYTLSVGITSRLPVVPRVAQVCILMLQGSLAYMLIQSPHPLVRFATVLAVVSALTSCVAIGNQYKVFTEQVRTRRRLKNLATHDSLTGLPNRHLFETTLEAICLSRAPFTLWMLDLDSFKEVNDTYGHAAGDELLRQVSRRLEQNVRTGDLLARLGGDEFVILQPQVHLREAAENLAERIEMELRAPYLIGGHQITIGASIGIKLSENGEIDADGVLLEVDRALYRVKDFSRGGFEMV